MSYPKLTPEQWAQIPPEYVWFTIDYSGQKFAHKSEPELKWNSWWSELSKMLFIGNEKYPFPEYKYSLQKRPTTNELPETAPTPDVAHIRLSMPEFERIAKGFNLNVRHCETYCDAAMYNPAGQIAIVFAADVPVNVTVHDSVNGIPVTVHDQISLSKCKCGNNAETEHNCPYAEDILGVSEICNCCKECTYQCSQDI